MKLVKFVFVAAVGVVMALAVMFVIAEQQRDAGDWWADARPVVVAFTDEMQIAGSTSRMSIGNNIREMQRLKREFEAISTPDDAQAAQDALDAAMETTIDILLVFSGGGDFTDADTERLTRAWDTAWGNVAALDGVELPES